MTFTTRFAPSPTGPLHLGHAFSAMTAHDMARAAGGRFLIRIEDIDQSRSRPEWEALILQDMQWLGLRPDGPVRRQSDHFDDYRDAIKSLSEQGLAYPCSCSRRDIEAAASAPQEGVPAFGPDGRIYPGTCRGRSMDSRRPGDAIRLDLGKALPFDLPGFAETGPLQEGWHPVSRDGLMAQVGDPVLARPNMAASYHLSVVIDDAAQHVTDVVRGADLFEATFLHVALQALLGLPVPRYHHHRLIRDADGKRLAKRDDARAISLYRAEGSSPDEIRQMVGLPIPSAP